MNTNLQSIKYIFRMSRPLFWFYLAGPVIVGTSYGASSVSEFFTPATILCFLYFLIPANIYLYGVNDLFDKEIDKLNPKKSEEGQEEIYRDSLLVRSFIVLSGISSIGLYSVLSHDAMIPVFLFVALGFSYSAKGIRLKTKPLLDSVSNGMYILPGLAIYMTLSGSLPSVSIILGAWIWSMSMHTFSAIPDIDSDREGGIRTTATYLGKENTLLYCGILWLISSILFVINHFYFSLMIIYPLIIVYIKLKSYNVSEAYWWYPYINVLIGCLLSLGGIYVTIYGEPTNYQNILTQVL